MAPATGTNELALATCVGGVNVDVPPVTGHVVPTAGLWTMALASRTGLPSPPPSCPRIVTEVATGSMLERLMVSTSPTGTTMVGPGDQLPPVTQAPPTVMPALVFVLSVI